VRHLDIRYIFAYSLRWRKYGEYCPGRS
jgi:hypothetical protein